MNHIYKVKVNNTSEFDIDSTDIIKADIITVKNSKYHIIHNDKTYVAEVSDSNFIAKVYTIKINNNSYDVSILNAMDLLIKTMGFEVGSTKVVNKIIAPMPGLILDISVKVGQTVEEDDSLLILEAMKMENNIISPRSGIIKSIVAKKGAAVEKNQLLIEFE